MAVGEIYVHSKIWSLTWPYKNAHQANANPGQVRKIVNLSPTRPKKKGETRNFPDPSQATMDTSYIPFFNRNVGNTSDSSSDKFPKFDLTAQQSQWSTVVHKLGDLPKQWAVSNIDGSEERRKKSTDHMAITFSGLHLEKIDRPEDNKPKSLWASHPYICGSQPYICNSQLGLHMDYLSTNEH